MADARPIVERPADAWREPAGIAMLEAPRRQDEIDLLRRMPVVGIAHARRQQGGADGEIAKSIQRGVSLEKKLRDNRGNPLSDTAIGDAIRQVSLTKEDVNAINIRLATSRTQ